MCIICYVLTSPARVGRGMKKKRTFEEDIGGRALKQVKCWMEIMHRSKVRSKERHRVRGPDGLQIVLVCARVCVCV